MILTSDERIALESMAKYWQEVRKRPIHEHILQQEAALVTRRLGAKLLLIIEDYLNPDTTHAY